MKEYLENVRCVAPLIHNITNYVTANDVANVLLAGGPVGTYLSILNSSVLPLQSHLPSISARFLSALFRFGISVSVIQVFLLKYLTHNTFSGNIETSL